MTVQEAWASCGAMEARPGLGTGEQPSQVHVSDFLRKHSQESFGVGGAQSGGEG